MTNMLTINNITINIVGIAGKSLLQAHIALEGDFE